MSKERIQVSLNNEFYSYCDTPKEALGTILVVGMRHLEFMPDTALRQWIEDAISLVNEWLTLNPDTRTKRHITNIKKYLEGDKTRDQLLKLYLDIIMSSEGLATLSGFGMATVSKTGGRKKANSILTLNPERMSIYRDK
jgi:hypothetical protein